MLNKVALTETQIKQGYLLTHGKCASTFSNNNSSVLGISESPGSSQNTTTSNSRNQLEPSFRSNINELEETVSLLHP